MRPRPTWPEGARRAILDAARHRAGILTHRDRLAAYTRRWGRTETTP